MPNQDALTLAKVAIEAYGEWRLSFDKNPNDPDLCTSIEYVAAAIDRHMEIVGEVEGVYRHYEITQEPRGGEDGDS